jgi:hypothetical protein
VVEVPFLLLGLLREDVAVISMLPLDLARTGKRKALLAPELVLSFAIVKKI